MSVSQAALVWFQIHSGLNEPGGMMLLKSTVDAVAANPHRAGVRKEIWASPTGRASNPPHRMTCAITDSTRNGMVFSEVFTIADTSRPSVIEATASNAMATII